MARTLGRRAVLAAVTTGFVGNLTGCLSGASFPDADVIAGPDGRDVFEPETLTITVGDTVTWGFSSSGHNVSCRPDDHDEIVAPDEAESFASYARDEPPLGTHVPQGDSYEHTFETVGEYSYVCVPHVDRGMIGTIRVKSGP